MLSLGRGRWLAEGAFVLAAPPVLFFLYGVAPINQAHMLDPYVYTGYIQNFHDLYDRYGLTYYSVRFGLIAPGRLLA